MNIQPRKTNILTEDRSWLGSQHGTDATRTITLDMELLKDKAVNGVIKSGILLARVTETGKYGPYDAGAGDGRNTAAGHLFNSIPVIAGTTAEGAPLLEHGAIVEAKLPAGHGVDETAKTALAGRIIYR